MKTIAACLILVFSATLYAQAPSSTITEEKKAEVATLGDQLCSLMMLQKNFGGSPHTAFESGILKFLGIDKKKNSNYRTEISKFWNQYNEYMICTTEMVGYETPQHLLKRVVDMSGITAFYFEYFLEDENINLNAIEWKGGEPETLVDYIDKIILDPNLEHIYDLDLVRQLRGFATNTYDGKRACELLDGYDCQARYDALIENAHIDAGDSPCQGMAWARQNNKSVVQVFESNILNILGIPVVDGVEHSAVISKFWNKYGERFNCEDPGRVTVNNV